jgi:hypothetical protein
MASHRDTWSVAPCDLSVTRHTVKAAWFASGFDPHMIRLFSYGVGRWDLLVVPPRTETATAARLMAAAADPALRLTVSELLAAERHLHAEDEAVREQGRMEQWEGEGGAPRHPSAPLSPPATVTVRDPLFASRRARPPPRGGASRDDRSGPRRQPQAGPADPDRHRHGSDPSDRPGDCGRPSVGGPVTPAEPPTRRRQRHARPTRTLWARERRGTVSRGPETRLSDVVPFACP